MKTECHCLFCPKHPLHSQRKKLKAPTGYNPTKIVFGSKVGKEVDCLIPQSDAFDEFDIDYVSEDFPTTAYGDGTSMTGFERDGITLYATCRNEEYVE